MWNVILATLAVSLISLIGAVLLYKEGYKHSVYGSVLINLAAGVMLAAAILDLLPEAIDQAKGGQVYWAILVGIVGMFVLERLLIFYHHHDHGHAHEHAEIHEHELEVAEKAEVKPSAYLILFGDSFHNFFDGVAIATSFSVSYQVGMATTIAVIIHEIPHELANFVALVHQGMKAGKALLYNFLSGWTALLGAVLGWYFIQQFNYLLPDLLGFSAGMFIYIACSDMIPALHEKFRLEKKWMQTFTFLLGVVGMGILMALLKE